MTDNDERKELADLIASVTIDSLSGDILRVLPDGITPVFEDNQRTADTMLAAGYRKAGTASHPFGDSDNGLCGQEPNRPASAPLQQVTTVEELDRLPLRTVVAAITHNRNVPIIIVFQRGSNWEGGDGWTTPEAVGQIPSEKVFEFIGLNCLPTVFTVLHNPEAAS